MFVSMFMSRLHDTQCEPNLTDTQSTNISGKSIQAVRNTQKAIIQNHKTAEIFTLITHINNSHTVLHDSLITYSYLPILSTHTMRLYICTVFNCDTSSVINDVIITIMNLCLSAEDVLVLCCFKVVWMFALKGSDHVSRSQSSSSRMKNRRTSRSCSVD